MLTVAVLSVVAVQVVVPTVALFQPLPARFGFQMYSGYGSGTIRVLDTASTEIEVDFNALLPRSLRPELDWTEHVPQHLCSHVEGAALVVIERDGSDPVVVRCG